MRASRLRAGDAGETLIELVIAITILGQSLTVRQWAGVGCVMIACAAVTVSQRAADALA